MKNLFTLIAILITGMAYSQQMAFSAWEFTAEENAQDQLAELFDERYLDKEFKSGGVSLERLGAGRQNGSTHRMVWIYELGKRGLVTDTAEERRNFRTAFRSLVESWGEQYSGRIQSWQEGDTSKTPHVHIWLINPADPDAFKKGHDKIVDALPEVFKDQDRTVGFGTFDINMQRGASHWVAISGSNSTGDHINLINEVQTTHAKKIQKHVEARGEVEIKGSVIIQVLKRYM
tara:strand:- start:125 stop:820 length:696 start_codon:yes stop_codon:yes gene_type:complete